MRKDKALLALNRLGILISAVDLVKSLESIRGPDDKTAAVSTRGELEKVQTSNLAQVDTRDVAEGTSETALVVVVDHKRATTLDVTTVTPLALTSADAAGGNDTLDIVVGTDGLKALDSLLGLLDLSDRIVAKNKRDLRDVLDLVTTGNHEGGDCRSSDGRDNSIATELQVHTTVNATESGLGRVHVTTTSHVTEGSLTTAVSATTSNTRNTCDSTASTPALSRVHQTNTGIDTVSLMVILVEIAVNDVDEVTANRSTENGWEGDCLLCLLASKSVELCHNRTCASHLSNNKHTNKNNKNNK